ncbi:ATP-binding cassette family protein [filamentous cyanobacterium CCP2]|nr:ATP-binding cassette family protein [filamentous cyanobacterium CCP2]
MIPLQLTLKNFLSYREATLDFRGLHVACICGANGAGKSSLLEGIIWAIWGQSRAQAEDNVIHLGTTEAIVDFTFQCHQQTYRVIRSRYRGQASTLEFQIQTPNGFRSLTEKGVRATQNLILQHLRLDYDTFINSAYLRQGRADEFMLKRPSDRKQILADLLKLDQYDGLSEQAREQARELKAEISLLERNLESMGEQLQQREYLAIEAAASQTALQQLQQTQQQAQDQLRHLQAVQQQRQSWLHQLSLHQEQQQHLTQDCQRLQRELHTAQQHQRQLEALLQEAETISSHYAQFQRLQADEEVETAKFQAQQAAQARRQELVAQQVEQVNQLTDRLHQAQAQLATLQEQEQDIQQTLAKTADIEAALQHLHQARSQLTHFDHLQMKAAPLVQRRQQVQTQVDRVQARLMARLEELRYLKAQLQAQQQRQPQLQQAIQDITAQIKHLEARKIYQQKVREKGTERRTFLERLQERQRELEREFSELDHKILMLQKGVEQGEWGAGSGKPGRGDSERVQMEQELTIASEAQPNLLSVLTSDKPSVAYPPCPLCDRPLDEHHWTVVLEHHRAEQQEIQQQLWVIREQLTTSDREIRILRQEYRDLDKELAQYGATLEKRGQLQQQLQGILGEQRRLQEVQIEISQLEHALQQGNFATELQEELQLLDRSLLQLDYDDKNHALARGEVDRWRWAEIKHAEIKQAQRRQAQIAEQKPELERTIATLKQELNAIANSPLQHHIHELEQHIAAIGYHLDQHTAIRQAIRQAQPWQLRYQELLKAQQNYPHVQRQVHELVEVLTHRTTSLQTIVAQAEEFNYYLEQTPDSQEQIQAIEQQIHQNRSRLDEYLAKLGSLQQQQQHLETLSTQHATLSSQLQTARRQYRVYQELTQAFGKNGIQALMIENVLPQLEAETNQILGRLSANQLHVQFVTQRAKRGSSSQRHSDKLIDTLDILISDVQGTRPYETYSGGEAFRVNFAIRLALARLLAQRSGTALQMLIIDEGFGTQDDAGCDRLIGAINAISSDFACILAVTHIPHLREAFQTRVEVYKAEAGSRLRVLS